MFPQGGAMSRSYRKFDIEDGVLSYEEMRSHGQPEIAWTAKVEPLEMVELYTAFRKNAFDLVENDERDGVVHDAGSESISLSLGLGKFYRVTYGHNSPLSGRNLERYRAVKRALDTFLERHRPSPETGADDERLSGTWRVAGERGGHAWYLQWKFENGRLERRGYPPLFQKGRYRITNVDGDKLTIDLYDQEGNFGIANRTIQIAFDADETLTIGGRRGFKNVSDQGSAWTIEATGKSLLSSSLSVAITTFPSRK